MFQNLPFCVQDCGLGCVLICVEQLSARDCMTLPETRASLILRLSDAQDVEAWDEFVEIYSPLLFRLAKRKGFQHADAQEFVQEVLIAVSKSVDRWEPDPERGRFRSWLFQIARNLAINFMTRPKYRSQGAGDTGIVELLENQCDPTSDESAQFDLEYRREVFRSAAQQVCKEVKPKTWEAFWLSTVDARPISEVAQELSMSAGNVYIARSRVMARLQEYAKRFREVSAQ